MQRAPYYTDHRKSYGLWIIVLLTACLLCGYSNTAMSQEKGKKSQYEKRNEKRNKANRRSKRRKDDARSNRAERRALRFKIRHRQGDNAHKGDITGRRIKPLSSSKSRVRYAQPNPYAGRKKMTEARRAKYLNARPRYSNRSGERTGSNKYSNNRSVSTSFAGKKAYKFQPFGSASRGSERSIKTRRVVPRSASGAYVKRKRKKPYAFRERSKWEQAYQGDITGRKFRTKGTTDRPRIQGPPTYHNRQTKRRGDRPYSGKAGGGYASASRMKEHAGSAVKNNRSRLSISRRGEKAYSGNIDYRKNMSVSKDRDTPYNGNVKRRSYLSISGKHRNVFSRSRNNGRRLSVSGGSEQTTGRLPRSSIGAASGVARYRGSMRSQRPDKGGGSISGGLHNNRGRSVNTAGAGRQDIQIAGFSGKSRSRRIEGGGGSISGGIHNNKGRSVNTRQGGRQDIQVARFSGRKRSNRIEGGGGSITAQMHRNNDNKPVQVRQPRAQDIRIAAFSGRTKGRRGPPKGAGGSISVLPWNNDEKALPQKTVSDETRRGAVYVGNIKRTRRYVHNPSSGEEALMVLQPAKNNAQASNYQGRQRQKKYVKNPMAADNSLKGIAPTRASVQASRFQGHSRRMKYDKNPNAADDALKGIGPSRAMIKASQFQGNIKMSHKRIEDRHPSYKFADKSRPQKKTGFNLKLMWSRLFKKQENQPGNVKEKEHRPRYDKGEKGIWND